MAWFECLIEINSYCICLFRTKDQIFYHGRSGTSSMLHLVYVYGRSRLLICGSCLFDGLGLCSCQKGDSIRAESCSSNVYNHLKGRNGWLWLEFMQGMVSFKGEPLYQTLGTGAKKWNRCYSWALHQHSRYHMQGNKFNVHYINIDRHNLDILNIRGYLLVWQTEIAVHYYAAIYLETKLFFSMVFKLSQENKIRGKSSGSQALLMKYNSLNLWNLDWK